MSLAISLLALAPLLGGEERLLVVPDSVSLERARDYQRIAVYTIAADGTMLDSTRQATLRIEGQAVAEVSPDGVLRPVLDGEGVLTVDLDGVRVQVPISVRGAAQNPPLSFRLDVLPLLTSLGCNVGSCHGSARGQDGFHLSLFGFDPGGDHGRIIRQYPGRRVNLAFPSTSLLLEKPTAAVPHSGGKLFEPGSLPYETLQRWVAEGGRDDGVDLARVTGLQLWPSELTLIADERQARVVVRATYSDGTDRDVTRLAILRSSNEASAAWVEGGNVRAGDPGEAFLTASYGVHAVGIPAIVLPIQSVEDLADPAEGLAPANWVDELLASKFAKLRLKPSPLCSDEVFLRRLNLDVLGVPPSPAEREAFLADPRPGAEKRAARIDDLLERPEFTNQWVMLWAELLRIRSNNAVSGKAALRYFEWLRDQIGQNTPADELVLQLLTATGGTFSAPATNFYELERDNLVLSEDVAQAFLGVRLQCAKCHNHPFDRWTQDDYYGFAAFFSQVGRKAAEDPRERVVFNRGSGEVKHPIGGRNTAPKFLGGDAPDCSGKDRRQVLAAWLTAPENPWFARNLANRLWAHFLGRGIVEPVDDLRVSNPPANGPLLEALAERLRASAWDVRALARAILNSRAYQRAAQTNETNAHDDVNFSHANVRRLRAETLLDSISFVTRTPTKFAGLPLGARAVQIADGATSSYFLATFGRAPRESVCACEVDAAPSLSQALHLMNGDTLQRKIQRGGVVKGLVADGLAPEEVLDALYLLCVGREPRDAERETLLASITAAADVKAALEDVFWALLNSQEFMFQH